MPYVRAGYDDDLTCAVCRRDGEFDKDLGVEEGRHPAQDVGDGHGRSEYIEVSVGECVVSLVVPSVCVVDDWKLTEEVEFTRYNGTRSMLWLRGDGNIYTHSLRGSTSHARAHNSV